jgi:hypothetical protein
MNFDVLLEKFVDDLLNSEMEDFIYYKICGSIHLFVNGEKQKFYKMFIRGTVRNKSVYIFDICLTITKHYKHYYEIKTGKLVRKNYFMLNSTPDKIPIKDNHGYYANIKAEIAHVFKL